MACQEEIWRICRIGRYSLRVGEDLRPAVGASIKRARLRKGIGQAELGVRVGELLGRTVSEDQISHWENARNLPRLDAAWALAKVLGTSIDVLVAGEEGLADQVARLAERVREVEHQLEVRG